MSEDVTPEFVLFVGGFVAGLFLLASALTYSVAPGDRLVEGFTLALAGLGGVSFLVFLLVAAVLWVRER